MQIWMLETGRRDTDLALELTGLLGKSISSRQVFRWRKGKSYPRPAHAVALDTLSNGRVTASSFAEARLKTPEEPHAAANRSGED